MPYAQARPHPRLQASRPHFRSQLQSQRVDLAAVGLQIQPGVLLQQWHLQAA